MTKQTVDMCSAHMDTVARQVDSTQEMPQGPQNKSSYQSTYKNPNNNRWHLDDYFYVRRIGAQ
ncbi:hypothetical protein PF007_g11057 [Phytophthora fragariae]|nr:hypothetical protein PF009_g12437 [Phytophthora fragariae]KAE9042245.1 hypothetical protein PR001_g6279 [Phytophthora rubi]KAE9112558.1 hypothetical protein PF007_g11057 [Phytophthora fragariae]KAE9153913.1 hypothetical protein PF006_g2012 [Phytophthora fragariae]